MADYLAPIQDMNFVLSELVNIEEIAKLPGFEEATPDLVDAVLEEAGKVASEVLAPLNTIGDVQGSRLVDGKVQVPEGFADAYKQFVEGGWLSISQDEEFGGQGMPYILHAVVTEMWNAANTSFALNPMLTGGATESIRLHASDELKQAYLPQMISGEWTGAMDLTEPQAGSDLSAIRTKATPDGDHYLIEGQKIFITWGDHEMADNVIHLVLARLPDAPEGVKGISLFLVPKFLVNEDGSIGERNDVYAVSLEHKLGIHASPTCVMSYGDNGGAIGYLVGQENKGLAHMFTMMNDARLGMGLQGVAIADRAYQHALAYARDRVQGAVPGIEGRATILHHPDVRRMLMLMRTMTEAMRAVAYVAAGEIDFSHHSTSEGQKSFHQQRLDLLVPIAKGWCTEVTQEIASLGIQVHGGMGFVEETGAAQYFRDARIATIYEGTTGIQAMDLVGRKILRDQGEGMKQLLSEMEAFANDLGTANANVATLQKPLMEALDALKAGTTYLLEGSLSNPQLPGAVAFNLLMLMGTVFGGYQMVRAAAAAQEKLDEGNGDTSFYQAKLITTQFYCDQILPRAQSHLAAILSGPESIMSLEDDQF